MNVLDAFWMLNHKSTKNSFEEKDSTKKSNSSLMSDMLQISKDKTKNYMEELQWYMYSEHTILNEVECEECIGYVKFGEDFLFDGLNLKDKSEMSNLQVQTDNIEETSKENDHVPKENLSINDLYTEEEIEELKKYGMYENAIDALNSINIE